MNTKLLNSILTPDFWLLTPRSILTSGFWLLTSFLLFFLCGCQTSNYQLEPKITFVPPPQLIENLPSSFPELTPEEMRREWAKELIIANRFANESDFYRAITSYKRALFLLPPSKTERRMQIEYGILSSYYLGRKYQDTINFFETSLLANVPTNFPPLDDLLIMLEDSYQKIGDPDKAYRILSIIETRNCDRASQLRLSEALSTGRLAVIQEYSEKNEALGPVLSGFLCNFHQQALSVRKTETLNAILPGAGYFYVGLKKTALTSFLINALFIAAAYQFFKRGDTAAGIITTSLEAGWYLGGINGAGLAAKTYNERLYNISAKELMISHGLFPVLMLQFAF